MILTSLAERGVAADRVNDFALDATGVIVRVIVRMRGVIWRCVMICCARHAVCGTVVFLVFSTGALNAMGRRVCARRLSCMTILAPAFIAERAGQAVLAHFEP